MRSLGALARKDSLRAAFKQKRLALSPEERASIDAVIAERVCELPEFENAELIACYLSFGAEVETRGIIERAWQEGKTVALPRCVPVSRRMRWYTIDSLDGLERHAFGMQEPAEDPAREVGLAAHKGALAIVPALAVDMQGYRLGYGGGYYDAFLAEFPGVAVGLCREAQVVENLAALGARERYDIPVDLVITETRFLRAHRGDEPRTI